MVELEVFAVHEDGQSHPYVLLRHEDRYLPMMVGVAEANAIIAALAKRDFGRPMTHDLVCNLLAGLRGELKSVTIYKLENDIFFAHLNIEQKSVSGDIEQVLRIDSRPSDGIAIAVRVGCPIFAAEEVMDQAARDLPIQGADDEPEEPDFDT